MEPIKKEIEPSAIKNDGEKKSWITPEIEVLDILKITRSTTTGVGLDGPIHYS